MCPLSSKAAPTKPMWQIHTSLVQFSTTMPSSQSLFHPNVSLVNTAAPSLIHARPGAHSILYTHILGQGSANCSPRAKPNAPPSYVNKVLSEHGHAQLLMYCLSCFHTTITEFIVMTEIIWFVKPKNIYHLALDQKILPTAVSGILSSLLTRLSLASLSPACSTLPGTKQESSKCSRSERPYS